MIVAARSEGEMTGIMESASGSFSTICARATRHMSAESDR